MLLNSFKGQIKYCAPEILFGIQIDNYDYKIDVFSLGYTIYYLMNKELPTATKVMNSYFVRDNKPIKKSNYNSWLVQFVDLLHTYDKTKRPTASEALKLLEKNINNP